MGTRNNRSPLGIRRGWFFNPSPALARSLFYPRAVNGSLAPLHPLADSA
jgi:hypothetical protein